MIKIAFHGGVEGVTGSRHLISINDKQVLFDCGLFQGRRGEYYERNLNFTFDPAKVNAMVASHAHIDHIGALPNLVKKGFKGEIHCTLATADLVAIMLNDSARVNEADITFVNKIRAKNNEPPVLPIYGVKDVPPVLALLQGHGLNHPFDILPGIKGIFRVAGHILGSVIVLLNIDDVGRQISICYTGDLGRANLPIICDPFQVTSADVLIIESTYGNRLHSDIRLAGEKLAEVINRTVKRGGKIIVPVFALERTQELVHTLHVLRLENKIPPIPIYVDSPLAIDATDIFRAHPECFDAETAELVRRTEDPFGFRELHYTRTAEESRKLNDIKEPMMILSTSGMAEAGRILHHLRNNIEDPKNTVLIVGYQAENTLARKIAERWKEVPIFGIKQKLNAEVVVLDEFSGHADQNDLLKWVAGGKWKKIFIVHGEKEAAESFAGILRSEGWADVNVPKMGESFTI
jgi:metallo-beta-lactamase family protein